MPTIEQDNWRVSFERSASSGIRLRECDYMGVRVLHSAAVPFVYVQYKGGDIGPFTDELRSFSNDFEIREIMFGFDICARYDLYGPDYQYDHIWRFHDDGQFGSAIIIHGPGEEILGRHTYYVPFRFDIDISGASGDSMQSRRPTGEWVDIEQESISRPLVPWAANYDWRVIDKSTDKSARLRARTGDNAQVWTLKYSELESWSSWGGVLKSPPGTPGSVPEIYQTGQSVQDTDLVVWYIAEISSADRVTVCGPWFALDGYPTPPERPGDPKHPQHPHPHDPDHPEDPDHPHPDRPVHPEPKLHPDEPVHPEPKLHPDEPVHPEPKLHPDEPVHPEPKLHPDEPVHPEPKLHPDDQTPLTKFSMEYLGRKVEIEPMVMLEEGKAGEHGHMALNEPLMYVVRVDGKEILAHPMGGGGFHTHELPFVRFQSVQVLAETYVNYLEYGIYHGSKEKPE
jgi:hypothetical protein